MRLKQLEVSGFKSFAQRTSIEFPAGITAIVGPNGCGKSNVVDAIRWVLGEQSPKHLRGDSMEDVVFKGNDRVPPVGMAQVSLTFENDPESARRNDELDLEVSTLPAHFRGLSEITVTRRYFRSGESEYFINRTACRLKDITELFLGTGVGAKAYAIIEQGRVEQLVKAKPEERRLFIEEAAGTTLYRSRKLAAERKMERTRENLLRVTDILRELERQIQYLHRMAKKAEQYAALQAEVRALDLQLSGVQLQRIESALQQYHRELSALREREAEMGKQLGRLEQERQDQAQSVAAAEAELSRWREQAAVLEADIQSLAERAEILRREAAERQRRAAQREAEAAELARRQGEIGAQQVSEEEHRRACALLLLHTEGHLDRTERAIESARRRTKDAHGELERLRSAAVSLAARGAEHRNQLGVLNRRRHEAERRRERLEQEIADLTQQLTATERGLSTRQIELIAANQQLQSAAGEKERCSQRVRSLAEDRRRLEQEVAEVGSALSQVRSRLESLREIQRNFEGYQRGVQTVLREASPDGGVLGVVADVLDVPEPYERAVAAALGERLQYVIVRDGSDGVEAVSMLRQEESGRGSFIPVEPRKVDLNGHGARSLNGSTRRLLDVVKVDDRFQQVAETLLGEVVLVPDLATGLALWRRNGVYVTMVTPQGDTIDANGVITGGSERPVEEEIVARRRLLLELTATAEELDRRAARSAAELEDITAALAGEETKLKDLDRGLHALTLQIVAAEKDVERLEGERQRSVDRLDVARFDSAAALAEMAECDGERARIEEELKSVEAESDTCQAQLCVQQAGWAWAQEESERLGAEVTQAKVRVAETRQRYKALVETLVRLEQQGREAARRLVDLREECERTLKEHAELLSEADGAAQARTQRIAAQQDTERQMVQIRTRHQQEVESLRAHEEAMQAQRRAIDEVREQVAALQVALAEQKLRLDHLIEGIRGKYGVEPEAESAGISGEQEQSLADRLESLREKLSRIGEVNVGAIDELRELEERAQFLRTQKEDLERSLEDLAKTIQRLNRASRTRFAETFAAVNEQFQRVLPRLFRGGEAKLVLTDENNLLESGVEIVVRPPGKRLETMTLLSGGEKALVAVSLIFSLFLINPTPFCFLDEVDAPLDDANIGRFTELVKEMSQHSQFIVITHNKRTMQAADVLYGVTMQEPGVSTLISVDMH
jgi:chromosome segregation protein